MEECVICGGSTIKKLATFIYDEDDNYFLVENVPAEVCTKCGERTYSPEVTDEILIIVKQRIKPQKTIEVPVFDLAGKV